MNDKLDENEIKLLNQKTAEELWHLFPITLVPHNPQWKKWAESEIAKLSEALKKYDPIITHIGSTAINGIYSKPIVDILVEAPSDIDRDELKSIMESEGYIRMAETLTRISFNKGYTPRGYAKKVFHVHVHSYGENSEIYFRDYLNGHPDKAREYESLKLSLLPQYKYNREAYTEAKSDFVMQILHKALLAYSQIPIDRPCNPT